MVSSQVGSSALLVVVVVARAMALELAHLQVGPLGEPWVQELTCLVCHAMRSDP